ncbi:hypothetical protein [Succinimonas sp.]|uniref:hypothetical protein n=1 Tax=Succinimonas sp. TaxID=1936151 RepID=UPI00386BB898
MSGVVLGNLIAVSVLAVLLAIGSLGIYVHCQEKKNDPENKPEEKPENNDQEDKKG